MAIKCNCSKEFEGKNHRVFDVSKLTLEQQRWPFPAFSNILKEFTNYQLVKCPNCGKKYRDSSLKLLFFFSPVQLLMVIFFFIVAIVLLVLFIFGIV